MVIADCYWQSLDYQVADVFRNGEVAEPDRPTRERLLAAALNLFEEHGYQRTTVGAIEEAVGLTPRCGGFYKHFASKREILESALEHRIQAIEATRSAIFALMPLGDLHAELTILARWALHELRRERGLLRILQREADEFPDLISRFYDRLVATGYAEAAKWVEHITGTDRLAKEDAEALGLMMVGAIVNYRSEEAIFGRSPAGVDEERFVQTWVRVCSVFFEALRKEKKRSGKSRSRT